MCFQIDCFTRKGCPQLIVHTGRLKWPVAKQWEQTFVKGIISEVSIIIIIIKDRIQSQKVVSITNSLKRVVWFVAYQDLNKEEN